MNFLKRQTLFPILSITIFLIIFTNPAFAAWDTCPFGLENDAYPGDCGRYIDTNNDGICDQSQPNPATTQSQESEIDEKPTNQSVQIKSNQSLQSSTIFENKNIFNLIISLFITSTGIILTKILSKKQLLSPIKEKIIWNIILLIFFMPSAITGVILIFMVDFPILREISVNFIELHSYTSFFFMWISAYHIIWHTTYYTKGIKKLTKQK